MFNPLRVLISDRQFKALLLVVAAILLIGMVYYHEIEGWRLLDSLYFSVITLTTVGYEDFSPHTDAGKIFTMVYVFVGIGIILAFVSLIARKTTQHYTKVTEAYIRRTEEYFENAVDKTTHR